MFDKETPTVPPQILLIIVGLFSFADGFSLSNDTETTDNYSHHLSHNELTSQSEEQYSEKVKYLQDINMYVWLIVTPILMFVGLIGNTLSILVLRR